jgi:hypothetical protein
LRNTWAAAKEVTFKALGPAPLPWRLVEGDGWKPMVFRGAAIVLEEYDGFSNVLSYSWIEFQFGQEYKESRRGL